MQVIINAGAVDAVPTMMRALLRPWLLTLASVVVVAVLAAQLTPLRAPVADRFAPLQWAPAGADGAAPGAGAWTPGEVRQGAGWVRTRFALTEAELRRGAPALVLSGVFSARVYLNGAPIGDKGRPSLAAAEEIPGAIDAVIPLGAAARAGENELVLFVSLHQAHHRPGRVIQDLTIAPFGAEPRRPASRYIVAFSQAGLLLVLGAALAWGAAVSRRPVLRWAALGAGCLLLALLAETSRSWWSYPYPLHVVRQGAMWAGLFGFGACLYGGACARVGAPPWRYIALVGALSMASLWFGSGIDSRALACFVAFAAAVGWVGWRPALAGDATAQALTSLVSAAIAYAMLRPGEFLDNGVYVLGALLLAAFQWGATLWRDARDAACTPAPVCERAPEEDQYRNVVFIKAEGNYAQVRAIDGAKLFLRQTLSEFPLSGQFVRVHRSYIVNLAHAQRLVANTGSRYHLELTDGASVPVSRKLVNLVRERLSNASPARP